jgi:hypothetical protein
VRGVWGRPAGMNAVEHRKVFEREMRKALNFLTSFSANYSGIEKEYRKMILLEINPTRYTVSVNVKHMQGLQQLEGYRNIRWYRYDDVIDVWIEDVCYSEDNGNKGHDYVKSLKLIMVFTDRGVETFGKRIFYGPFLEDERVFDDDKKFTYQGHPINTGDQVIQLVRKLGHMECLETLV